MRSENTVIIMENWTTGFYQDDLNVHYENYCKIDKNVIDNKVTNYKETLNSLYVLLYVNKGECDIKTSAFSGKVKENSLVLVKPQQLFLYSFSKNKVFEYVVIDIQPTLLKKQIGDKKLARAFDFFTNENSVIDLDKSEFLLVKHLLNAVMYLTMYSLGRCHFESKILSIISELCIICDANQMSEDSVNGSESIPVEVINYILAHYTEKLTYSLLAEKFFTSASTINVIVKNFTGKTLKEFITKLRMEDAKHMIDDGLLSLSKIAEYCGYKEYSAFYKAYIKYFGNVPKKDKKPKKRWPLSKN